MKKNLSEVAFSKTVAFIKKKRELEREDKALDLIKPIRNKTSEYIKKIRRLQEKNA